MKKLFATLISHNVSLFGNKFILGQSYQPELTTQWRGKHTWKLSYYSLNLGILNIQVVFSHDGVHELSFGSPILNHQRADKIVYDVKEQNITHTWNSKDHAGNHRYSSNRLFDWAKYDEFGTRISYAKRIQTNA